MQTLTFRNVYFLKAIMSRKRILYGEANYETMIRDNGYFVDKARFIRLLEDYKSPVFLRPRRFGKPLW